MSSEQERILKPAEEMPPSEQSHDGVGGGKDTHPRAKRNYPYIQQLHALEKLNVNYSLENRSEFTKANGWNIDSYEADLPPEPPGPPIDGGSFAIAKDVIKGYRFVDPSLIQGYFDPETPLLGRVMLLKVRVLLFFTFEFGTRVSQVIDEVHEGEYRWGYAYQTLEGHFEKGEITFKVVKEHASGKVFFRINSYSKLGHISNIFYRIGAALFGRKLQLRFARYALRRVQEMVAERLEQSSSVHR